MSVDAGSEDDLIGGAIGSGGYGGGMMGRQGSEGNSPYPDNFAPTSRRFTNQFVTAQMRPIRAYVRGGAIPNLEHVTSSLMRARAWQDRQAAKASEIVANRTAYLELASRLDGLGRSYPYLPADVAYGLAMAGHGPDSPAAGVAAGASVATDPRIPSSVPPESSATGMTAKAALDFAHVNADMGDADLVAALRQRGFDPSAVQGFTWDGTAFHTVTDPNVTAPITQVLESQAQLEDDGDDGGFLGDAFGGLKWFSRGTFAFLTAPWEALNASMRENYEDAAEAQGGYENLGWTDKISAVAGAWWGRGWDEGWDETTFAEASRQLWKHGEMNAGTGWFMGGSVAATKTARDYAYYANQIGEEPATMGRLTGGTVLKPGSVPFGLVSGLIDGTGALATDPSTYIPAGFLPKVAKGVPILGSTMRASHFIEWSGKKAAVEVALSPTSLDSAVAKLDNLAAAERSVGFPRAMEMPRAADQAGLVDAWAPRWYAGGGASDSAVLGLLRGGKDPAERVGLKLRSRRKIDGELEPVTLEVEPDGLRGYADTTPETGWAEQIERGYSTQIVPVGETADDLRARVTKIHLREPLDEAHPLNAEMNRLVSDEGWHVVRRNYTVTGAKGEPITRQTVSLYRPDQQLPPGTRVSPFVDRVDESTGEINRVVAGGADGLVTPLSNWTASVTADLGPGTFLTHFPEVRPLRTQELFDRQPLAAVTDPDLLTEVPAADSFRVMYQPDQLRGGVDVEAGAEQTLQSVWKEDPLAAWPKPKPPKELSYDEALASATKEVERAWTKQRPAFLRQVEEQVEAMHAQASDFAPQGILGMLSKADKERFLTTGEVPLEDVLNAMNGPNVQPEELARYLEYGPVPGDEQVVASNDDFIRDLLSQATGDRATAEKLYLDWRQGKPIKVRTKPEMKALAQPEGKIVGRVLDDAGNVVREGRRVVVRKKRSGGGAKITTRIPGVGGLGDDLRISWQREYGDPEDIATYLVEQRAAERAAAEAAADAPPIYVAERADLATPVGKAESAYPDFRLFDTARTGASDASMVAGKGTRAVAARYKGRKPAKVADLDDAEVAGIVKEYLDGRLADHVNAIIERQLPPENPVWAKLDELDLSLREGTVEEAIRRFRELVVLMPESQGASQARAAAEMERILDLLRANGYDVAKWTDSAGKPVYELLDEKMWRTAPVKTKKVAERAHRVDDAWDDRRFGVRFSARQAVLRDQMASIDAPKGKPTSMDAVQWDTWKQQRNTLLKRGWTVEDTPHGREVLRKPLNGEYDGKAGQELHRAMAAGDVSNPADEVTGLVRTGTRETFIPEQTYKFLTDDRLRPLFEKIAATESFEEITNLIGRQPAAVIGRLIRAQTADEALEAVIESVGLKEVRRLSIEGAGAARIKAAANTVLQHTPGFRRSLDEIRLLHVMPGQYVNLRDADEAAYELHNWMMTARVPKADRDAMMKQLTEQGTAWGRKEIYFATFGTDGVVAQSMKRHLARAMTRNKDDAEINDIVREALTLFRREHERNAAYHIKDAGEKGYVPGNLITSNDEVIPSPHILGDFFDGALPLPNPRDIKRMTSALGRYSAAGFDLRRAKVLDKVIRGLDGYNSFFKVTALARIAYPVRVMLEEQGRLYGAGYANIYTHPLQYVLHTVKGNKGTDLLGRNWIDLAADPDPNAYGHAMVTARLLFDNDDAVKLLANHYDAVGPADDRYLTGWMFGLGKLHGDPVARRLVGKWTLDEKAALPEELVDADPVKQVAWWLASHDTGREYLTSLREASATSLPDFSFSLRRAEGVETFVQEVADQVRYMTAQHNPDLVNVIRNGKLADEPLFVTPDRTRGGQVYNSSKNRNSGFTGALRNYTRLEEIPATVIAPDTLMARDRLKWYDQAVTGMFSLLNGRPTNYLSRSPLFREHYVRRVVDYMPLATDDAAETLVANARKAGITRSDLKAIETAARKRSAGTGDLTAADIDGLAKTDALDKVQEMLYDTTNKTHFWDAMRIVAPFGAAWAEVMKTWTRLAWNNPKILDRLAHGIHGAQQTGSNVLYEATGTPHDSDQGFFFKDLRTGDEAFAWPMPAMFQSFLTMGTPSGDAGTMMPAPVAGLNLIGQVQPGFGPVVTATAQAFLDDPGWQEDVLNFIAPFGGPSAEEAGGVWNAMADSVTPAWVRKLLTAVYPATAEQKSQLQSAVLAAQVHLASTGKYDMGNPDDVDRLLTDAKGMARRLFFLRAIGQFVLPTIGSPEQAAYTGNGELVLQTKLSAILRQYQSDPGEGGYGYQEGYLRFLRDFGAETYLLGVDRTDSSGMMAPTKATYDWMRRHPDLMRKYDQTWGLLVDDAGNDFYYPAYQAQVRQGYRTLIDPEQLVELANARIGRALYTSYRAQYEDTPSESEANELRMLQDRLELMFPGYSRIPTTMGSTSGKVLELERASRDPAVANLPVGASLRTYFERWRFYRDQGISSFRTGLGREVAPDLYELGSSLAAQDPTFRVAWDRLLVYDFDSEQFGAG